VTQAAPRRRLPTERRREEILAAALDLFGRRGFDAVGMRDVAAACELSATGIYRHFVNKEALLLGLFDRLSDLMRDAMRNASRADSPGLVLDRLVRFHVGFVLREPVMIPVYQREEAALPPGERDLFRELLRDYLALWTHALMQLNPDVSLEVARTTVVATFGTMNGIPLHTSGLSPRALEKLVTELAWRTLGHQSER
jgi:AcrR family transcriptional regulator